MIKKFLDSRPLLIVLSFGLAAVLAVLAGPNVGLAAYLRMFMSYYSPPNPPPTYCKPCKAFFDKFAALASTGGQYDPNCSDSNSSGPINYSTGELILGSTDLVSSGFGGFSVSLSFDTKPRSYPWTESSLPPGWYMEGWPKLLSDGGGNILALHGARHTCSFKDNGNGTYTANYFHAESLTSNSGTHEITLTDTLGNQTTYFDFSSGSGVLAGHLKKFVDAAQNTTTITYGTSGATLNRVLSILRSTTVNGTTTQEQWSYTYGLSGAQTGLIQGASLQRQVNSGGYSTVRQVSYTFYATSLTLQRAIISDGSGNPLGTKYFRYYPATGSGFYGLKYVVFEKAYERLKNACGGTDAGVDSAIDATVGIYANGFFQYDSLNRVTQEIVQGEDFIGGCSCSPANNEGTYGFTYTTSGNANAFGNWSTKTVETLPDGNQNIVYANFVAMPILKVFKNTGTGQSWLTFIQYDGSGREIQRALPSAVTGYNETVATLGVTLSTNSGLIQNTDYYSSTNLSIGAVAGYRQDSKALQGSAGTPVLQDTLQYTSHTDGSGITIYPLQTVTRYRNTDGTGAQAKTASFTWQGTTNQMLSTAFTYPTVTTAQNGPGTPDVETQFMDFYGRITWLMDGDGFIHYREYDQGTAALTKLIADVNTANTGDFFGLPSGWTTVSGGGLHLKSLMVVDGLGRNTKLTDPKGNATYIVYNDPTWEVRTYPGWNSSTTLPTGPTQITRTDKPGSYVEILTTVDQPTTSGGAPTGQESVTTANLQTLTRSFKDTGDRTAHLDTYFSFAGITYGTGTTLGTLGTNFYQTVYGYDAMGRQDRRSDPSGTITRTVFDPLGRFSTAWLGTNDTPASGIWSPTNNTAPSNMLKTLEYHYDDPNNTGSTQVGDGTLTQVLTYGTDTTIYTTQSRFDFRDRLTDRRRQDNVASKFTYDNLSEITLEQTYADANANFTIDAGELRQQVDYSLDERNRVYLSNLYEVLSGTVSNKLPSSTWFNRRGQVIKTKNANALFGKLLRDGAGRTTRAYASFDDAETSYADAFTVTGDQVIEETINYYDAASNLVAVANLKRPDNDTTSTGDLSPTTAFVTAEAAWFDLANRPTNVANFGRDNGTTRYIYNTSGQLIDTNGNGIPDVSEGSPLLPNTSDNYIANQFDYDSSGFQYRITDNLGKLRVTTFDRAGKGLKFIENYQTGAPSGTSLDTDVTTERIYLNGVQLLTYRAYNPKGGSTVELQDTTYSYTSPISAWKLTGITYPDSSGGSDQETFTYDRLGRELTYTDPRGVIHTYAYDSVGRLQSDAITTLPAGVDGSVLRFQTSYDDWGRALNATSYNAAAGGSIVNDVQYSYDQFYRVTKSQQSHSGAVGSGTPAVQYTRSDGAASGIAKYFRLNTVVYPATGTGARTLTFAYPAAASIGDHLDRLDSIKNGSTTYAQYTYYGGNSIVSIAHPQVSGGLTLDLGSGGTFTGLDRFGRIAEQKWKNTAGTKILDDYQYAYDRNGNTTSRAVRPTSPPSGKDDFYSYDGANRITGYDRGNLSGGTITDANSNFNQHWTALESLGDWRGFQWDPDGGGSQPAITQSRTHNDVNEVTSISNTGATNWISPTYDASGDMASGPQPGAETTRLWYTYDGWNRLVTAKADNSGVPGATIVTHSYDALHRRIVRAVAGGTTFHYYYDESWRGIEVRDNTNTAPSEHYVWDPRYVDSLIVRFRAKTTPGSFNETLYYTQDANNHVTALVNTSGAVQERYTYDPYGNPHFWSATWTSRSASNFANENLYAGYRREVETGLYQVRNRYYHATVGRFIQRDPVGYSAGTMNLYEYVGSTPTDLTDPSGLGGGGVSSKNGDVCIDKSIEFKDELKTRTLILGPGVTGDISAKFGAKLAGKVCPKCCEDKKWRATGVTGSASGAITGEISLGVSFGFNQ